MAPKSKRRGWWPWRKRARAKPGAARQPEVPTTIKKGIYLSALIYIEGEQSAPEDFSATATTALKQKLRAAFDHEGDLSMSLKRVEVQNDIEEDGPEREEKFQF